MLVRKYKLSVNNTDNIQVKTEWVVKINDLDSTKDSIEQVMKNYLQIQKMKCILLQKTPMVIYHFLK